MERVILFSDGLNTAYAPSSACHARDTVLKLMAAMLGKSAIHSDR
ncbi:MULTISPECIES: hypothetical protein [unclassified Neisseria]|nr:MULTISPECIES: hypothetical protein [unclassified Neisseria]